ncbi:MAG: MFS transporter [Myxococcaceae bacterium]|nr:MFS transporter [Myxococcaceae bacterium]
MAPPASVERFTREQLGIVGLVGLIQLVNILDFVMVMPLGPWFSAIGISPSQMGLVGGAYTLAACVAGLAGASFLDRFGRKAAILVCLVGLSLGTLGGALAVDLPTLLLARVVAGAFGGPATSLAVSIIADTVQPGLRGRAMGLVMAAFAAATVFGVPFGLWCAEQWSFRAPFVVVGLVAAVVIALAAVQLPPLRGHLALAAGHPGSTLELLTRPLVLISYLMTAVVMAAGFAIIPNISNYLHLNLGVPLDEMKHFYLVGGLGSLAATQAAGRLVDRFGSFKVAVVGTLIVLPVVYSVYYRGELVLPVVVVQTAFMVGMGFRNVSYNSLTSKVPGPTERARFTSFQSAVQHGASALAAMSGTWLLSVVPRAPQPGDSPGREPTQLAGMPTLALMSMALTALVPLLVYTVEGRVLLKRARVD